MGQRRSADSEDSEPQLGGKTPASWSEERLPRASLKAATQLETTEACPPSKGTVSWPQPSRAPCGGLLGADRRL